MSENMPRYDRYRWKKTKEALRKILIDIAINGEPKSYEDVSNLLCKEAENDSDVICFQYDDPTFHTDLLSIISEKEVNDGHGMLSVVVVSQNGSLPGDRFFSFAKRLRRYERDEKDEDYWMREYNGVVDYWRTNSET